MGKIIIKPGDKFNKWTVIDFAFTKKNFPHWKCRCQCGKIRNVLSYNLLTNKSKSCGCLRQEQISIFRKRYPKIYSKWCNMAKRKMGRCERWTKFENFLMDMGIPDDKLVLSKVDQNKEFCKENCKWVTRKTVSRNTPQNVFLQYGNRKKCLSEWSEITGINFHTIYSRLSMGWNVGEALGFKKRKKTFGPRDKLTKIKPEDVKKIRQLLQRGVKAKTIADRFGISDSNVYSIAHRKTWNHVK